MLQNISMAKRFLAAIAGTSPITYQVFDDDKEQKNGIIPKHFHGSIDRHKNKLIELNDNGAGIFFMVNQGDLRGRSKNNVTKIRCLFVDLDGSPLEPVLNGPLAPHIIVRSSPGRYHAYWIVNDIKLGEFKPIQKALALMFDGDPVVNDLPRVMRLPGFLHKKGEPYQTKVIKTLKSPAYDREQFIRAFNIDPTPNQPPGKRSRAKKSRAKQKLKGGPIRQLLRRKLRLALSNIPAVDYNDWIKVGMALHSTGSVDAFKIWDQWSRSCPQKYDVDVSIYKWNSFSGEGVGLASLYELAIDYGWSLRGLIPNIPPTRSPRDVSISEGKKLFKHHINNLISSPLNSDGSRRVVADDVTPGFGKSTMTWDAIVEAGIKVEAYVPTHDLADEVVEGLKKKYGIDAMAIKGRDVEGMCYKPELLKKLAKLQIIWVYGLTCEKRVKGQETVRCQYFSDCPYFLQNEARRIKVFTHAHLPLTRKTFDTIPPDLVVIDEQFLKHLVGGEEWSIAGLMRSEHRLIRDIATILNRNRPLLPVLRKRYNDLRGTVVDLLDKLGEEKQATPDINPAMTEKRALRCLQSFSQHRHSNPLSLLNTLLTAIDSGTHNTTAIWTGLPDKQRNQQNVEPVIKARWLLHPERLDNIPIFIIDGSMAINAIRKLFPEVEHNRVRVGRFNQGPTIQVFSTPVPNRKFDPHIDDSKDRHREAKNFKKRVEVAIQRVALQYGPGLIVTKKSFGERLKIPLGCQSAHFGGVLGLNEWETLGWAMIIGRNQPPASAMVHLARAFYGNARSPLNTTDSLEKMPVGHQIRTGERVGQWVQCHVDPRVQQFMHLARENESEQALDRIRLVHLEKGEDPKPVFLLSNVPLDIEVDELVSMKQFLAGPSDIQLAWEKMGEKVLPLNFRWIYENFRDLFTNVRQVRTTIERERKYDDFPYIYTYWKHVIIKYRIVGKRGPPDSCLTTLSRQKTKRELERIFRQKVVLLDPPEK